MFGEKFSVVLKIFPHRCLTKWFSKHMPTGWLSSNPTLKRISRNYYPAQRPDVRQGLISRVISAYLVVEFNGKKLSEFGFSQLCDVNAALGSIRFWAWHLRLDYVRVVLSCFTIFTLRTKSSAIDARALKTLRMSCARVFYRGLVVFSLVFCAQKCVFCWESFRLDEAGPLAKEGHGISRGKMSAQNSNTVAQPVLILLLVKVLSLNSTHAHRLIN